MKRTPRLSRRQFLRGAGGFTLLLPFLPSLLPKGAKAEVGGAPFFVAMATSHGAVWPENMYPNEATLSSTLDYAGRTCHWGMLEASQVDGRSSLSPVLSGAAELLTPSLVQLLGVIRGIDIPYYIAHHTGGHLGNYARNDGNGPDGRYMQGFPTPTIDQVLAWSSTFYPDISGVTQRALAVGDGRLSYGFASPSTASGPIQELHPYTDNQQIFTRLFTPGEASDTPSPLVVDRILGNYQSLRDSDQRLSADDRRRLNEHMERLYELERRVSITPECPGLAAPSVSSGTIKGQGDFSYNPDAMVSYWQLFNDLVAVAVSCGVCRSISMHAGYNTFSSFQGDWHQDVAHQAHNPDGAKQAIMKDAHQVFFEGVFLDLATKLQALDNGRGGSALDDGLVAWSQESGMMTHEAYGIPIVTAGRAGGALNSGRYIDYRNRDISYTYSRDGVISDLVNNPGLVHNQWLGTVLQAMGLSPGEYEVGDYGGYGPYYVASKRASDYSEASSVLSETLPILTNT